jgi:hypothetical protein
MTTPVHDYPKEKRKRRRHRSSRWKKLIVKVGWWIAWGVVLFAFLYAMYHLVVNIEFKAKR